MSNIWLDTNRRRVDIIKRNLLESSYAGSFGGVIDLLEINRIIEGMIVEIKKLDNENSTLKNQLKALSEKSNKNTNPPNCDIITDCK